MKLCGDCSTRAFSEITLACYNVHPHFVPTRLPLYLFARYYEGAVGGRISATCSNQTALVFCGTVGFTDGSATQSPFATLYFKVATSDICACLVAKTERQAVIIRTQKQSAATAHALEGALCWPEKHAEIHFQRIAVPVAVHECWTRFL